MILDLHNHSVKSDDGRAKVENYCRWIRKKELPLDGFVLTEHRQYEPTDYRPLEDEYDLLILEGSEVETDYGHVLVFGINDDLLAAFDFARVDLPIEEVLRACERCGAVAAPSHPGRVNVGLFDIFDRLGPVDGIHLVETLNGGSRGSENERAQVEAERYGYRGYGGSDAHIVSHIGRCATRFEQTIRNMDDLVSALRDGNVEAVALGAVAEPAG